MNVIAKGRKKIYTIKPNLYINNKLLVCIWVRRLRLRLRFSVLFFFTRFGTNFTVTALFMHCAWTVAAKFDLSNNFQPISAHCALFTDPQISFFSNFFIKNWSHGTIHTFKNYFATVFFSFSFQFSTVSKLSREKILHQ